MIKNNFKDDYSRYHRLTGKGRVVEDVAYVGEYYIVDFENEKVKQRITLINIIFAVLLAALLIGAGLVNTQSSRTIWIVAPYLLTFMPTAYMLIGAVEYKTVGLKMQRVQYELTLLRMKRSAIGIMVLAIINVVLDIVFIIKQHEKISVTSELVYIAINVCMIIVVLVFAKYYNKYFAKVRTVESEYKAE